MAHVWIALARDADGYPPVEEEQLHVATTGTDLATLTATPAFAPGLAVGDVLRTRTTADGRVWATAVASQGDHWCSRVVPLNDKPAGRVVEIFASMGCTATATEFGLVTVDVPPEADRDHVLRELHAGRDEGDWNFDLGVDPTA